MTKPQKKQEGARGLVVIFGNGLIGRHLHYSLRRKSSLLTRKEVDLSNEVGKDRWDIPKCSVAYICAGIASTEYCESHREESRLVNVTNTIKLAERLKPARVIWISSERVFNGLKPYREVSEEVCPTTEYGRQKAETEKALLDLGATVVRFSKVIGWNVPLFEGWISDLEQGKEIYPFSNMSASPISVSFATQVLLGLKNPGLYQVSGDTNIGYHQIASYFANRMGKIELVHPVLTEREHPFTTLKNNTGMSEPDSWDIIQRWWQNRVFGRTQ